MSAVPSVRQGDMRDVLRDLAEAGETFHAVVTDPPYHLTSIVKRWGKGGPEPKEGATGVYARSTKGFMGKEWDGGDIAMLPETWRLVWDVLPPGGHLVAFGGTRTFHRMAVAIEDAGFEIRDTLMWLYGCLDDQSDALTRRGWVNGLHLRQDDEVMQWDASTGKLEWVRPTEILRHRHVGPMVRLRNRHTDQLLTPDHRVYAKVKRHSRHPKPGAYEVVEAGALGRCWIIDLPMAGELDGEGGPDPAFAYLAGWWLTDAWAHGDGKAVMFSQCKPETLERLRAALAPHAASEYVRAARSAAHQDEHSFYVTGDLADRLLADFPGRRLGWDVLSWSKAARAALYAGLMDGDGSQPSNQYAHAFWSRCAERRGVFVALALSLGLRAYEDAENGCIHVNTATGTTQLQARHRGPLENYDGEVWCVRVPKGAFVARRAGRPFITGNSGFPKSHNQEGEWDGWGTALKPAQELICWAQKPGENDGEWATISALMIRLWSRLWLMLPVSDAEALSTLNPAACGVAPHASAQWDAGQASSISADLCGQMGMLPFASALITSLSTVRSWSATLAAAWKLGSTSTTATPTVPTIDLKTLKSCLSVITPASITLAHKSGLWSDADACPAGRYLSATVAMWSATRALFAAGPATSQEATFFPAAGVRPDAEPIILARKPLAGTVAANCLAHRTGAINVDACRVGTEGGTTRGEGASNAGKPRNTLHGGDFGVLPIDGGRWPANVLHDGSDEVEAAFAAFGNLTSGKGNVRKESGADRAGNRSAAYGAESRAAGSTMVSYGDTGSASRFFYCGKAASGDRVFQCEGCRVRWMGKRPCACDAKVRGHPTVKPQSLMRWVCRLVTPPGGRILDCFAGSGSTLSAAYAEGFTAVGVEMDPDYVGDIQHRLAVATGKPVIEPAQPITSPAAKAETKPAKTPEPLPLFAAMECP